MKGIYITALAALASSAFAAPILDSVSLPAVSNLPSTALSALPATASADGASGHVVQDAAPKVHTTLTVTGKNLEKILIELNPEVVNLLTGLGLPGVGQSVGTVLATAPSVGALLDKVGAATEGLLTVVGKDGSALLIQLSPAVSGLLGGLGLSNLAEPVGTIVGTLGSNLKRDQIASHLGTNVKQTLTVTGQDAKDLLIELSPEASALVAGLGLGSIAGPVGQVVKTAANVGDLLQDVGTQVEGLLTVVGADGSALLIQLSPSVLSLVAGLGLPSVATPLSAIVSTVGQNL